MKIVRKKKKTRSGAKLKLSPWKVLIVDDDADIHAMTRLALDDFKFAGKKLQIFQAMSGIEAREIMATEYKIAVALIDVVMETDDAGLRLVDFIRNELKYPLIRLIVRTGQPGMAPEREVIERYDIDDYKDKTELTAGKLYTTMRLALKAYRDLSTLETNRKALTKIIDAAPALYQPQSLSQFFNGVLTQMIGLCNLGESGLISSINNGMVVTTKDNRVQAGTGRLCNPENKGEIEEIIKTCSERVLEIKDSELLPSGALLVPLRVDDDDKPIGFVYLEDAQYIDETDREFINIMVHQCALAMNKLQI